MPNPVRASNFDDKLSVSAVVARHANVRAPKGHFERPAVARRSPLDRWQVCHTGSLGLLDLRRAGRNGSRQSSKHSSEKLLKVSVKKAPEAR